jgi:hypothetical protein
MIDDVCVYISTPHNNTWTACPNCLFTSCIRSLIGDATFGKWLRIAGSWPEEWVSKKTPNINTK